MTTGASGAIDSRTEYDAFGGEFDLQSGNKGVFRFAGKHGYVTDIGGGLQLLGARYYLPSIGRFLTQDPIGHEGGLNLYAYASNNPLTNVDPTGLQGQTLNGQQETMVREAIGLLRNNDYVGTANALQGKLLRGEILFDPALATSETQGGALAETDHSATRSITLSSAILNTKDYQLFKGTSDGFSLLVALAGTLVHEHTHVRQDSKWAGNYFTRSAAEGYAYGSEIRFYQHWKTKAGKRGYVSDGLIRSSKNAAKQNGYVPK